MPDKGQKELGDLLKEGAAALVQMRKGIENACTELRDMYSRISPRYLHQPENGNIKESPRGNNNMNTARQVAPPRSY